MSEPSPNIHSSSNSDPMFYGVLGDDQTTSLEKLEKYTGIVEWSYLKPHYKNEALIFVDLSLSITEVGEALANDDADKVSLWRSTGDIITPSAPHASYWEESQTKFKALVVSPFVLIQPIQSK
ncbi:MAG: hypothetical protein CMO47_14190 [Verrucomicrobiales bacterium]|nr:hypothetical protein [Verrucomicrobiales bacterium]